MLSKEQVFVDKQGQFEDAIRYLEKSIKKSNGHYIDAYYDLAVVYYNNEQIQKALEVLEDGNHKKEILQNKEIKKLYESLRSELIIDQEHSLNKIQQLQVI